jgi:hypothetical protein
MIEQISLVLADESGNFVPVEKTSLAQIEIKIDVAIADLFSQICFRNNSIEDQEIKTAEKFHLAKTLNNYLEEMKKNANRTTD